MACCLTALSHYLSQCWLEIFDIHPGAISLKMCKMWWQKLLLKLNFLCICQGIMGWNHGLNACAYILLHLSDLRVCYLQLQSCILIHVNSLSPSDTIRQQRSGSTSAQVMACCLTAPSHYLNQYWLINTKVLWHSSEGIIMRRSEDANKTRMKFEVLKSHPDLPGTNELTCCFAIRI